MVSVGLVLPSSFRECDLLLFYWFIELSVPSSLPGHLEVTTGMPIIEIGGW